MHNIANNSHSKLSSVLNFIEEDLSVRPASKVLRWMLGAVVRWLTRGKYIILCESRGQRALNGSVLLSMVAHKCTPLRNPVRHRQEAAAVERKAATVVRKAAAIEWKAAAVVRRAAAVERRVAAVRVDRRVAAVERYGGP